MALERIKQIPLRLRLAAAERILKAMGTPIVAEAKALAPNSRTGKRTRDKMSSDTKAKWPESGKDHIGFVYRKTNSGGYLVIGAKDPLGNSFNFDASDDGRKVVLWGRDSGRIKRVEPSERFMQRAFARTRQAQITAGLNQLEKELKELNLG